MALSWVGERAAGHPGTSGTADNVITLASSCSAGNMVTVSVATRTTSVAGAAVSDSRGNTWTVDSVQGPNNNVALQASTMQDVGTLVSGDTITVHFTTAPNLNFSFWVEEWSGIATGTRVDKTATNSSGTGVTSATSGTTATTAQANELAIAVFCLNDAPAFSAFTKDTNYSWPTTHDQGDSGSKGGAVMYRILAATGTQVASVSWTGAESYTGLIITYLAGGTTYNDSPTGGPTITGTRVESNVHSSSPTGGPVISGTRAESNVHSSSPTGGPVISGTRTESHVHSRSASGGPVISGTRVETHIHSSSPVGGPTISGTLNEQYVTSALLFMRTLRGVGL